MEEYMHAVMLLHEAGKTVDEASMKKVLEAAGAQTDTARIKAVVSALEGVDIEQTIKEAAMAVPVQAAQPAGEAKADKAEEKKNEEEEKKDEENAAAGLGALFG